MSQPKSSSQTEEKAVPVWRDLLSGLIYGAGDDDPSAIGTYSQIGAKTGISLLWLLLISTPMLASVQMTVAKFGAVTKKGLSTVLREEYNLPIAIFAAALICVANIATLGADIAGTAQGMVLVCPVSWHVSWKWLPVPITLIIWALQVFGKYKLIKNILVALSLILISYIIAGIMAHPDWMHVIHDTFLPHIQFSLGYFTAAVGLLGATISPYMFYFQEAEEVEEKAGVKDLKGIKLHTVAGMIFSNLVGYFVILSVSVARAKHGGTLHIDTAADAAAALKPFAGSAAKTVLGLGLIGSGLLAIPVLAAATSTMISELARWRVGMHHKPKRAPQYYTILTITMFAGILVLMLGINPIKALYWSQILSGVVAPVLLFLIFRLSTRKSVLGNYTNAPRLQFWGWFTFVIMVVAVILMFVSWFKK